MRMRSLLLAALVAGVLSFVPETATAAGAPETFADFVREKAAAAERDASRSPKGPIEKPEDWIAVAGIVCYAVLPIVFVAGLGFLAYDLWYRRSDASLLGASARSAWIFENGGPPRGLVLLSF